MRRGLALWVAMAGLAPGVAAAPAAAGGGCHRTTEAAGDAVEVSGSCFTPTVLRVEPGTVVTWTNRDDIDHVVVGTGWALDATLREAARGSHRFSVAGSYPYSCHLHPGMNGVVVVGATPVGDSPRAASLDASPASSPGSQRSGTLGGAVVGAAGGMVAGLAAARVWRRSPRRTGTPGEERPG
jgi:plastocyanin